MRRTLLKIICGIFFSILLFFVLSAQPAQAASVVWDGGGLDGLWETATNWSGNAVPTSADDVTWPMDAETYSITLSAGQTANFNTLEISPGDGMTMVDLYLYGNIGTGGSITINGEGVLYQMNNTQQTLTGTLTVVNGGAIYHGTNTTSFLYSINISAATINLQSGSNINADGLGFSGGLKTAIGSGPGGGGLGNSTNAAGGGGGSHGGDGGISSNSGGTSYVAGGTGYCGVSSPATLGSGGGGGYSGSNGQGGNGGGLIILNASGTLTVNGAITADGGAGINGTNSGGGGAGGGIKLTAGIIAGTPSDFSVIGGAGATTGQDGGGGGGGCTYLQYTTSNSIPHTSIAMNGGTGYAIGGAGVAYIKQVGTNGDLFAINAGTAGTTATSTQNSSALTADTLTVKGGAIYAVTSTKALTLMAADPFINSQTTSTIRFAGGIFTPTSTVGFTISSSSLEIWQSAFITSSSSLNVTITNATTSLGYFASSSAPLPFSSLTVGNGGIIRHLANSAAQTHTVNLSVGTLSINAGGSINVDGLGFVGGLKQTAGSGTGPGGAGLTTAGGGGGGAHSGNGGAGTGTGFGAGGTAYCNNTSPGTIGSGGGGGFSGANSQGGAGGGLVILNITNTLTINGTITADGGTANTAGTNGGGGGAGGGVNITAGTIAGTPQSFTVTGSNGATQGSDGGGGGGGCAYLLYNSTISFATTTIGISGGTGANNGITGAADSAQVAVVPTVTAISPSQASAAIVNLSTTIADANNNATSLILEYSLDNSTWASSTLATVTPSEGAVTTALGLISGIDTNLDGSVDLTIQWNVGADIPNTDDSTVYFRIIPNDGTANGSTQTSAAFAVDTLIPTAPGNLGISTTSTQGVTFSFGSQTSETNFVEYKIFFKSGSSGVAITDSAMTSSTFVSLGSKTYSGETTIALTGLATSTQYVAKIWTYDIFGNLTPSASEISFYTLATAPGVPTVNNATATTLDVSLAANTNPAAVTYAIYEATTAKYLAADKTMTASTPVWQTTSTWTTPITVTGLSSNTSHTFSVVAKNGDGVLTATSTAGALSTLSGNTAPTASAFTPYQSSGTAITFSTTVADAESNATTLIVEYSTDNSTWASSTLASVTVSEGAITTSTGQISGIDTNLDGSVNLTIEWNAGVDINNTDDSTVYLRVVPNDGTINGSTVSSAAFAVDTLVPTAPGNLGISTTSTQGAVFSLGSQTTETNFKEYKIFYKTGASGVAITDSAMTSSTFASLGSKTYSGQTTIALTGLATSTQYVAKIWSYDTFGNLTPSASEISFYTLATAPGTPTVTASTTLSTALKIVLDQATNPSGVTYSICKTTNGTSCASNGYLQADGTLGASAVWQTYTTWGGATGQDIIGLTANTSYQFLAQARNGDNYVTSLSSASSATFTLANAVTSFSVSNISVTSTLQLQLSWTNNSQTGMKMERDNGCDGTYDVTLYDSASANDSSPTSTSSNLTANTCYQFKISSYNGSGTLNSSSVATTSQITTPPGQPQNVTASNIDTTEITWAWDAVTGATSYGVFNNSTGALLSTVTGATSYLQSPLSLNTSYSIVVRAVNANGTGIASSVATAVTGVEAPTGITAPSAGKTASSITWGWTDGGQSGFYARNKNLTTQNSGWIVTNSWEQTGLDANTQYTVQVKAKNSSGTNTAYTEASAYSAQSAPSGITFSSVTATGITATADGTFTNNGTASSLIHFDNGAGATQDVTSGASWANSSLTPNTSYTYTVYATNGNGDQTSSVSGSKYTLANAPGTISTAVGSSATTLVLTLSANSNPTNTNVVIYSSSAGQYVNSTTKELTGTSSSYDTFANWGTATVSGLTPNTSYQFLAVAKNGANVLTASSTASTALYTLAATPVSFSTVVDSSSQITTSWGANSNPAGTEFYAEVVGDSSKNSGWITGTSYAFSGLTQGTNYSFRVKARNGDGVATDWLTSSTATTQSSGGGGAAAVAAPVIIPVVSVDINSTPVTIKAEGGTTSVSNHVVSSGGVVNATFSTNSAVSMMVDDNKHTIVLNSIKNNVARFTAYSDPQSFDVKQGEEKAIDLNNDGHADLHILVKKISSAEKKADVTMTVLDDLTFTINDNMSSATSPLVTLRLKSIPNVEMISFSENKDFVGASFFPYVEYSTFKLSSGVGLKKVYARLRTKQGGTADVSDTITLLSDGSATVDDLSATPTVAATPQKSTTKKYVFKNYLYLGSQGVEVRQLQMKLKEFGFFTYPKITGFFGSVTKTAVIKFQKANKLKPYPGWVGKGTREALNQQ